MSGNVAQVNQTLADASIEQITAMALESANAEQPGAAEVEDKQDVSASSGQTEEQIAAEATKEAEAKAKAVETDKEVNFAKLRTKLDAQEREVLRLAEENKRLSERQYVAELPADYVQKVAEVNARIAEIDMKFHDGRIGPEERQEQMRTANAERDALLVTSIKAQIAKEMQDQSERDAAARVEAELEASKKTWEQTVDGFISGKPDSVDYTADEAKHNSLNTYVKALAADPDNEGKPMVWYLQEAHALVKAKHGVATISQAAADVKQADTEAKPTSPINTLSDLPGGLTPAKNEIEALEQVSGAALTNRFQNMTAAQIDAELAKLG